MPDQRTIRNHYTYPPNHRTTPFPINIRRPYQLTFDALPNHQATPIPINIRHFPIIM